MGAGSGSPLLAALREDAGGVVVSLKVQPRASRSGLAGMHGQALKVRLAAPPVDGKANEALLAFLAEALGVPRRRLALVAGETARDKRVRVEGLTCQDVVRALEPGS